VLERLEAAVAEGVSDPDGEAVRITFGWACSEGVSDCDLRMLTERADAALLRRKPARSR